VQRIKLFFLLFPFCFLTVDPSISAQQPAQESPTIKTSVDEVLLDVIVRDKKGKLVSDVKPGDLTVTDNGMKQKLNSFRLVQGAEAISSDGGRAALDMLHQIRLVTLTFEAMGGADQRQMARRAAIDLIKGEQGTNVYYAVVMISSQLHLLQPFTKDREALQKAIEMATSGASAVQLGTESQRAKQNLQDRLHQMTGQPDVAQALRTLDSNPTAPPGSSALGSQALDAKLVEIMLDMTRFDAAVTEGTRLSLSALQSLVKGMSELPGRKSILYFTWGLAVPPNLDDQLKNLESMANRANVTFYTIDTNGVMTYSQNGAGASDLGQATRASAQNATGKGRVTTDMVLASDKAEQSMRANNQNELRNLADSTGGFLVSDSNDLRAPLRKINEEISSYYEISYNPGIQNYDGSLHKLKVESNHKDWVVQARNGYFALPMELRQSGLLPYEVPLLKTLADGAAVHDVPFRSRIVRFQPTAQGVGTSVVVEVPVENLEFQPDQAKKIYTGHLSLVALIKNSGGSVVDKLTRDLPIQSTAENLPNIKLGNFIYKENVVLPPGKYTLETAVMDRVSSKIGAGKEDVEIAAPKGLSISNVTLVRSFAPGAKDLDPADPFQYQGGRITPTLTTTVKGGKGATLNMFFVVYPEPGNTTKPTVELEYVKDGQVIGKGGLQLPNADANGRIPYIMSSSAEAMPAGQYVIRALVTQGASKAEEQTSFTVEK
jgi:VWFA-related protein